MLKVAIILSYAAIGAFDNSFRGAGIFKLPGETSKQGRTQVRRVIYATIMGLLSGSIYVGAICFLVWLEGIGVPFGAAGGWNKAPLKEFGPIDRMACWLTNKTAGPDTLNQRVWGIFWLAIWGLVFGGAISACTLTFSALLLMPTAGVVCWITSNVLRWAGKTPTVAHTEWTFGAVQGVAMALVWLGY